MSESILLSILSGAVIIITAMLAFFLKAMWEKVEKFGDRIVVVQDSQIEIEQNYIAKFDGVHQEINRQSRRFEERFDELKEVLNNHFLTRHQEIVDDVNSIESIIKNVQEQVNENIRRWNEADKEFRERYGPALEFAKEEREKHARRSRQNVQ